MKEEDREGLRKGMQVGRREEGTETGREAVRKGRQEGRKEEWRRQAGWQ